MLAFCGLLVFCAFVATPALRTVQTRRALGMLTLNRKHYLGGGQGVPHAPSAAGYKDQLSAMLKLNAVESQAAGGISKCTMCIDIVDVPCATKM